MFTISAKKLQRRCSTGLWMWSFKLKFHKIISFRIVSKITVNLILNGSTITKLHHRFRRFWKVFLEGGFQSFLTMQNHFRFDVKPLILPQLISLWCLYYNILTRFYLLYVLEESEVVARKSSLKKVFLKIPENWQEKICAGVSFATKLQAGDLQLH